MTSVAFSDFVPKAEATPKDYVTLLKPGVLSLVVFTGLVGMIMAPGSLHPFLQMITMLCIAMGSGAGAIINMWYDRDIDAVMERTQKRPIPSGRIEPHDALFLGLGLGVLSVALLGLAVGWKAAGVLAFAIWFYAVFYTMFLKRTTPQNIVIGGAAGAFPPVIGWLAVRPELTLDPLFYFLIVFLWTPPHFWALALYRHDDYKRANIPMLPVTAGTEVTKRHILGYSFILVFATLLPSILGQSGLLYFSGALLLGSGFLVKAWKVYRSETPKDAIRLFIYSIFYLFLLFFMLLLDKMVDNYL